MRIFRRILIDQTERMKILVTANAISAGDCDFDRPIRRLRPRALAIQALCMGIVLFDFRGAVMGLGDFVIVFRNPDRLVAIISIPAAILVSASLIEFGIESLRADPT